MSEQQVMNNLRTSHDKVANNSRLLSHKQTLSKLFEINAHVIMKT